ncbi:hypothetical protein AB0G73_21840 [Streptomyces sp. NPDC020719]|uniref:hypothetical protein n=1 Tax=unclassified Streptomyces TaxID=2593676 RepID=UPI0033D794E0
MTEPERAWHRQAFIPASRPASRTESAAPAPVAPEPPIYQELAAAWAAQGRTLPGRPDREWTAVITRPCWPA